MLSSSGVWFLFNYKSLFGGGLLQHNLQHIHANVDGGRHDKSIANLAPACFGRCIGLALCDNWDYSKHLDDGIFELRAKVGSDISRVMYFFVINHEIILTHGFVKKSQKTPKGEIDRVKKYRKDYLERKK